MLSERDKKVVLKIIGAAVVVFIIVLICMQSTSDEINTEIETAESHNRNHQCEDSHASAGPRYALTPRHERHLARYYPNTRRR